MFCSFNWSFLLVRGGAPVRFLSVEISNKRLNWKYLFNKVAAFVREHHRACKMKKKSLIIYIIL